MIRRSMPGRLLVLALALFVATPAGWAFEIETHADISRAAFARSVVPDALRSLGIDPDRGLNGGFFRGFRTPNVWLQQGARDEDDTFSLNPARYRHHFFDPVNDRGLTTALGERAPDWALEDREEFSTQNFSYRDARQAFLTALTAPTADKREQELARTFETLGHVLHLVQDMASPPHTRNDSHAGIFGPGSLYELHLNDLRVRTRLNLNGTPVPFNVPRHYWTTGDGRGLAEFTNQNFVSEGTNFTSRNEGATGRGGYRSPVLRLGTDEQGRPFEVALDIQTQLEPGLQDKNGNLIEGSVTFFANNFHDPITGEALRNERMTTLSLFDRELARRDEALVFTLNRYNVEAQAAFLIPRAVGYSAGLLNYFFRGNLEVDLVEDPSDPSMVRVTGTNASPEKLDGGTLTLYADVPAEDPTQGMVRRAAAALDPNDPQLTVTADRDAPIESARFKVPEDAKDAERFVAVYTGRLGNEVPQGEFPGAVIGKVLGGVRVEQVFLDGERWTLRTPTGVFPLHEGDRPLTRADLEEVRWGDGEHTLVARTPFGPEEPNRVVAYEVPRQPNSVEVETVATPEGPALHLRKMSEAAFPFGLALGTTVEFFQTLQYRQQLVRQDPRKLVCRWEPRPIPSDPNFGEYVCDRLEVGPLMVSTVKAQTISFAETFPLVLDAAHDCLGPVPPRPYCWGVGEVAVNAAGHLLAQVVVVLTTPASPPVSVPFFRVSVEGALEVLGQEAIHPAFERQLVVRALVDVTAGQVLASTAAPTLTLATHGFVERPDWGDPGNPGRPLVVYAHFVQERVGGPQAGVREMGWGVLPAEGNTKGLPLERVVELHAPFPGAVGGLTLDGWLRAELQALAPSPLAYELAPRERSLDFFFACVLACSAVRVRSAGEVVVKGPTQVERVQRARPAPGGERLVLLLRRPEERARTESILVWEPATPRAEQLLHQLQGSGAFLFPVNATRAAALVESSRPDGWFLLPLEGAAEPLFFPFGPGDPLFLVLLEPRFLYGVDDLKFYRSQPPLQRTALPAKLADAPGNPFGDYHAIRLP